ncbi:hypothetical protein NS228_07020 [Methylobacterium indicum]|uniref:Uncharacterized protein n=1 Tax=Methylobacterium indicum TaxID=1775910 RepID=A0A0J6TMX4_9HYPH|nr:hypothetical protein [Methylobacterium indicum]KMO12193.1 hypothetical protein QR78_27595 [Methylobacterium indicum]KMO13691.1 hypothetical protein QR79_26740 [Methylobacterium indicum]KTS22169.1 hypothetical protein NS229_23205 [Methylobacterium indicum]KTS41304.1 hypothetical protein NS228_07020 [Methylobacterium indicum]KTS51250.1 hypothetical protein NS230_14600 [Methylobacterium indicum]
MPDSRFVKADTAPPPFAGPFAPVLAGVSRGLQDLFPLVEPPRAAQRGPVDAEREAVAPVLRPRPAPTPHLI